MAGFPSSLFLKSKPRERVRKTPVLESPKARATTPELYSGPSMFHIFRNTAAKVDVTVDEALAVPAIWACVSAIAESLAASEWTTYRKDPKTGDREYLQDRVYELMNFSPNPEMTAYEFKEFLFTSAALTQGGLAEIEPDAGGRPKYLWPIAWNRWALERDRNGKLFARVRNDSKADSFLEMNRVLLIRGKSMDGQNALPIVNFARETIAHAIAVKEFGAAFFGNGASLSGVLETDEKLNPEQNDQVTAKFRENFVGARESHGVFTATHGYKWKSIGVNPDNGQFIETAMFIIEEVARYYRMPPHKIQHLLRATNNNIEEQGLEFTRDTLVPWAERGAQQVSMKLLRRQPLVRCRVDLDWLSEGDGVSKAQEDTMRIHMGDMSQDEVRRKRGRNQIEGGAGKHRWMQQGFGELGAMADPERMAAPPAEDIETLHSRSALTLQNAATAINTAAQNIRRLTSSRHAA